VISTSSIVGLNPGFLFLKAEEEGRGFVYLSTFVYILINAFTFLFLLNLISIDFYCFGKDSKKTKS
jgi:hypothetical protein